MKSTIFRESEVMEIEEITEDYVLFKGTVKRDYSKNPDLKYSRFKVNIGTHRDDQSFLRDCKKLGVGGRVFLTTKLEVKETLV